MAITKCLQAAWQEQRMRLIHGWGVAGQMIGGTDEGNKWTVTHTQINLGQYENPSHSCFAADGQWKKHLLVVAKHILHLAALHRRVATNKRTFSLNWEQHLGHVWEHNSPKWLQYVSCVAATIFNRYLPAFAYVGQWNHGCERKEEMNGTMETPAH